MKKKLVLLLVLVMVMTVPVSSFALTDEEMNASILETIKDVNDGNNGVITTIDNGEAIDSTGPVYIPRVDAEGNVTDDGSGDLITYTDGSGDTQVISSASDAADLAEAVEDGVEIGGEAATADDIAAIAKPKMFGIYGNTTDGKLEFGADDSLPLSINPPSVAKGLVKSYAIVMANYNSPNDPVWMAAGITPEEDGPTTLDASALGYAHPGAGNYRIIVYALNADVDLEDGFTYEELQAAMSGKVVLQSRISGVYAGEEE